MYKLEGECVIIGDLNLPDADWETGKVVGGSRNKNLKIGQNKKNPKLISN